MDFDQRPTVPSHVVTREIQGELVLLSLKSEAYFGLDPVGTKMWGKMASSASLQHAYSQLLEEYDVDPERLRTDMEHLLLQLVENGLLELHPASSPPTP